MTGRKKSTGDRSIADRRFELKLPSALFDLLLARAEKNGEHVGALLRRLAAEHLGRPELAIVRQRGENRMKLAAKKKSK